ncbi:MAG TPA: hybrid sensor histidine kinase/response regulator [Usitatibacter sp.]|nr:hybrid sensor histidine kinase/response regulator [Usitatibacter sp.]
MGPSPQRVLREVLSIGFRSYPRALGHGVVFAVLTVALMWDGIPHAFLVGWFGAFLLAVALRLVVARAFFRARPKDEELGRWIRLAGVGVGVTGLVWGIAGVVAIQHAPETPLYAIWVVFLIALFGVLQTQSVGAHPAAFLSFYLCGMVPIVGASIVLPSPHYVLRLFSEAALITMSIRVGGSGNRYVADSVRMRFENVELLRDVTHQKEELARQKEELDRANAAKTRFLAAASHDLRQPMQAIGLLVEALQERATEPAMRRIVESIRSSVGAMTSLLNEILDISRLDAGTVEPRRASFPIDRVLDRLRGPYSYAATQKYLEFRIRGSAAIVYTDEVLLYRILANLLNNALRYTREGGVLVGCRRRAAGIQIEVWDTGIGIPGDKLEEVFQEFRQLGNPQRDRDQGLGLGLAIVERTARVLGLRVNVRSRLGRGSVFSIVVPEGDAGLAPALELRVAEPLDGCAVLVVDDDREIRSAMKVLLEGWKCRVECAASAAEVEEALVRLALAPDVVIADYRLPDNRTGLEVIARLREAHPAADAIVATGDVSPEALRAAQAAGYPVLHKPLRPARLRSLLGAAMRKRGTMREGAAEPS